IINMLNQQQPSATSTPSPAPSNLPSPVSAPPSPVSANNNILPPVLQPPKPPGLTQASNPHPTIYHFPQTALKRTPTQKRPFPHVAIPVAVQAAMEEQRRKSSKISKLNWEDDTMFDTEDIEDKKDYKPEEEEEQEEEKEIKKEEQQEEKDEDEEMGEGAPLEDPYSREGVSKKQFVKNVLAAAV